MRSKNFYDKLGNPTAYFFFCGNIKKEIAGRKWKQMRKDNISFNNFFYLVESTETNNFWFSSIKKALAYYKTIKI